jgi:uncharacterized protein (TIGR02757 family)
MKKKLDRLYDRYNRREYVHPDPLTFLYNYEDVRDREIAGLIAASLAYGKVAQILVSVARVLDVMGKSPYAYLQATPPEVIGSHFKHFVHRFATGAHLSALLAGIQHVISEYGSIYHCFASGCRKSDETILPALTFLAAKINAGAGSPRHFPGHLMPCPEKGSACKRLNLYLRWMVRSDAVDPGGWTDISPARLIVPLDVHMFRIAAAMGLTHRRQADMATALAVTEGFRQWSPDDPVRYDFALTRFGIRHGVSGNAALEKELGV